jgi:hypothetical protein
MSSPAHTHTPTLRDPHTVHPKRIQSHRPWAVTVIGWLLLAEVAALLLLGFLNFGQPIALAFLALALLALGAAVGFAQMRRGGWVNAVLVQGGGLLTALLLYFGPRPTYCYGIMLVGILMVLYLHQADVQTAFRQAPGPEPGPP